MTQVRYAMYDPVSSPGGLIRSDMHYGADGDVTVILNDVGYDIEASVIVVWGDTTTSGNQILPHPLDDVLPLLFPSSRELRSTLLR